MKQFTDRCLKQDTWIIEKIQNENSFQLKKWGVQTHSAFEWLTYTTEELGELAKAIADYEYRNLTKDDAANVVKEAIQVATLALKIAEMFDDRT